jgi:BirA family biotin operon repressor/biotin-[acetyl-CoA-carboxylase] ligase
VPKVPTEPGDPDNDGVLAGGFGPVHQDPITAAAMTSALTDRSTAAPQPVAEFPPDVLASRRPIDPARVAALLTGDRAWTITHTIVTGSTNADLAAAAGLPNSSVLTTEEQLTGRGRSGRDWFCPAGAGLMFSVLLREPAIPPDRRGWTGAVLGLAIVRAMSRISGVTARLKWPNDVLVDGRKCAGILGEVADGELIVGAGINVSLALAELPRQDATSLWLSGGRLDRAVLLAGILDEFGDLLGRWVDARGDVEVSGLRPEYRSACSTIGAEVSLLLPGGGQLAARAVDVAPDGALVVVDAAGLRRSYAAGEVVHVRPGA